MAVGLYALGRHLTAVTLTTYTATVNTGVLVPGISVVITGLVDETDAEETVDLEEISPITTSRRNKLGISYGTRFDVVEIQTYPTYVANVRGPQLLGLKSTFLATGYVGVTYAFGGNTESLLGIYAGMSRPLRGKGKQIVRARFEEVDNGVDNWLFA